MGIFTFLKKLVFGQEGMEFIDRLPKWYDELENYGRKQIRTIAENRKL